MEPWNPARASYAGCSRRKSCVPSLEGYRRQGLGFRIVEAEIQERHLHALDHEFSYRPVPVARYGTDQLLGSRRAVRHFKVGDGQVRRPGRLLQTAAPAQDIAQPVQHPAVVHLDERRAGEGVQVGESDLCGGEVRECPPGAVLDLFEPPARDLILFIGLLYEESEKEHRDVQEVILVQRDERERAQSFPQGLEALTKPRRFDRDHERGRERVPSAPAGVLVAAELQATLADEALPYLRVLIHPYNNSGKLVCG